MARTTRSRQQLDSQTCNPSALKQVRATAAAQQEQGCSNPALIQIEASKIEAVEAALQASDKIDVDGLEPIDPRRDREQQP